MYRIIFSKNVNYVMWGLAFAHLWTLSVQQGDCDFETGLCGYQQDNLDDFNWTRNHGTTPTTNTGPSSDHTTGRGYYMYIETSSPQITGDIARLISPSISNDKRCLEFWYHMYGDSTDELRVFLRPTGSSLPDVLTWSKTGDKGDVWRRARVHLDEDRDFNIVFEGVRGTGFRGDIAIDDLSLRTTPCGGDCDFDTGLCGYQQDNTDSFDWTRQSGTTGTSGTGPSSDHTTGSAAGSYIYIEVSGRQPGDVARLISPILSTDINCLEFWYHMYGNNTEELRVYQSSTDSSQLGTPIWSLAGDQGDVWHNATVGLVAGSNFYVVFEGVRGSSFEGDIAIDDVSVRTTSCSGATVTPTTTVDTTAATAGKSTTYLVTAEAQTTAPLQVTTPVPSTQRVTTEMAPTTPEASTPAATTTEAAPSERDCDFDNDVCGYQQDNTDDFDWARGYGTSSTTNTGPSSDHTGNGYYIFIEASSPQEQGDVARLMTPTLPTNTRCLEFWYHMYGSNIDQLNIYQRPTGNTQLGTPIWSLAGDQGNVWDQARLDLAADTNFKIVFEGVRGSGIYGDIAIDDVSFRSTPCGDGSCNFDIDTTLCGYQQDNTDDFDWTRQQGPTGTTGTGPSSDHTTGSGYYMYIEVSNKPTGSAARLISPSLSNNVRCLEFWYHMYGDHTEELNVYQRFTGSAELGTPIWSLTGDQGDVWQQATVNVVADRNFYIVFEGKRGSSYRGDIAIDDVSYRTTSCVATTVATTTTTTTASPSTTTNVVTTNTVTTTVSTTFLSTKTDMVTTNPVTTTPLDLQTTAYEPSTEDTTTPLEPPTTYMTTTASVTTQETTQDTTRAAATTSEKTSTTTTTDATAVSTQQVLTTKEPTTEPTTTPVVTTDETTLELTTTSETTSVVPSTITTTQQTSSPEVKQTTTLTETTEAWSTHFPTTLTETTEAWPTDFLTTTDVITTPMKNTTSVATTTVTTDEETTIDLTTALSTVTSSLFSTTVPQSTVPKVFTTLTYEHSSTSTDEGTTEAEETTSTPSLPTTKQPQLYTTKPSTGKPDVLSTTTRSTSKPEVTKPSTEKPTTGKAPPCGKDCTTVPGSKVTGKSEAQGGGSTGIIIGAAAGGAAVVLLVVVVIIVVVKCRRNGNRPKHPEWEVSNPMYDVAMGNMKNGNAPGYGGDVEGQDNSVLINNNKNGGKTDDDVYTFNMDTSNV